MADPDSDRTLLIVVGACPRAEEMDRPLAYRLLSDAGAKLQRRNAKPVKCLVLSDIWYLNSTELHSMPAISVGGPGVNTLSAYLWNILPKALTVDHVLAIQMDSTLKDRRCAVWGMDHDFTIEAVDTFRQCGHLDRFLSVFDS